MSGIVESNTAVLAEFERFTVAAGLQLLENPFYILFVIHRLTGLSTASRGPQVFALEVAQVEADRVAQHDGQQIGRGTGAVNRPLEPLVYQQRQHPAVVQMGVGQDDSVNTVGAEAEALVVDAFNRIAALAQAAIQQDPSAGLGLQQVTGPRDFLRRAIKCESCHKRPL